MFKEMVDFAKNMSFSKFLFVESQVQEESWLEHQSPPLCQIKITKAKNLSMSPTTTTLLWAAFIGYAHSFLWNLFV